MYGDTCQSQKALPPNTVFKWSEHDQQTAKKQEWLNSLKDKEYHDECAVYGYMRELSKQHSTNTNVDPVDIYNIIYQYFHSPLNGYSFEWVIDSESVLQKIKSARGPIRRKITCPNTFQIGPWKWTLVLFANGFRPSRAGSLDVGLELISCDSDWNHCQLVVLKTLRSPQTGSGITEIYEFPRAGFADYWPTNTLQMSDIQELESLIFTVDLLIVQIKSRTLLEEYHKQLMGGHTDKIWYQMKTKYETQQLLNWYLDHELMDKVKECSAGKRISNNYYLYQDTWTIGLLPNGYRKRFIGQTAICLALCGLPCPFDYDEQFVVEYTVKVPDMKVDKSGSETYKVQDGYLLIMVGLFEDFKKCKCLNITIDVSIMSMVKFFDQAYANALEIGTVPKESNSNY